MPSFIQRDGDPQIPPPYDFPNVTVRSYRLHADINALRRLCDTCLNIGSLAARGFEYRPSPLGLVDLDILHYPQMRSLEPPFTGWGYVTQKELYFRVLVDQFVPAPGDPNWLLESEIALFCPYILVDSDWSVIAGREVIGFPKLRGYFSKYDDQGVILETDVFQSYHNNTKMECKPLVEVTSETGAGARLPAGRHYPWGEVPSARAGAADPRHESLSRLHETRLDEMGQIGRLHFPVVQLKQIRDAANPHRACYQALIRSRMVLVGEPVMQPLPPATITLHDYASLPIRRALGLDAGTLRPLSQYQATCHLRLDAAENLFVNEAC